MFSVTQGCFTALITPMLKGGGVDFEGLEALVDFQVSQGVSGILAVGTTGESPTLSWDDHNKVIEKIYDSNSGRSVTIAGTGSNNTREAMEGTQHAVDHGLEAVLLVEPYYNGPSSMEIRLEYIAPIASRFSDTQIIPYVIPGRTGTQLMPPDLGLLHLEFDNMSAVKEATGDIENMRLTRKCCGEDFSILSGDDDITYEMMTDTEVKASGVISVASNIAPKAIQNMTELVLEGKILEAEKICNALKPFFGIVTVKTVEETRFGEISVKARNPVPYKTLMNLLGLPSGPTRQPLGRMTEKGLETILQATRTVYEDNPWILEPVEEYFDVDLSERLYEKKFWKNLVYD